VVLDTANQPTEHDQLLLHAASIWVNSSLYRCKLRSQMFRTFWSQSLLVNYFRSYFWDVVNDCHRFGWRKLQPTNPSFWISRHLTPVLYSKGQTWSYITGNVCKITFSVALYNCMCFISVYLLIYHQKIYVAAQIILNHRVHHTNI